MQMVRHQDVAETGQVVLGAIAFEQLQNVFAEFRFGEPVSTLRGNGRDKVNTPRNGCLSVSSSHGIGFGGEPRPERFRLRVDIWRLIPARRSNLTVVQEIE